MSTRIAITATLLILTFTFALAQGTSQQPPPAMPDMMKMHEQMMAGMKADDARLDALVTAMNGASGDAKVTAVAATVSELVRQQKAMHEHMGQMGQMMHQQMMGAGRGTMMNR